MDPVRYFDEDDMAEFRYQVRRNHWRQSLEARLLFEVMGFSAVYWGFTISAVLGWITLVAVVGFTLYLMPGLIRLIKRRPRREHYGLK